MGPPGDRWRPQRLGHRDRHIGPGLVSEPRFNTAEFCLIWALSLYPPWELAGAFPLTPVGRGARSTHSDQMDAVLGVENPFLEHGES
jgi:hypothetical protein